MVGAVDAVAEDEAVVEEDNNLKLLQILQEIQGIRALSTLTCQLASGPGVESISNMGKTLIFVLNPQVAHGKIFSSQEIEIPTSSVMILSC